MSLLPDIIDGKLVETPQQKRSRTIYRNSTIDPKRKERLKIELEKIKTKHDLKRMLELNKISTEINNETQPVVTEGFLEEKKDEETI